MSSTAPLKNPPTGTIPTRDVILERARDLVPILRERAALTEQTRRMPAENVAAFREAGFYKILQPARYGGYEMDYGTQTEIAVEIGRACGSSAWDACITACHGWILGMFSPEAQDDVWGTAPEAEICTSFLSIAPDIERVGDGVRLSGLWKFSSGVDHCDWVILAIHMEGPGGAMEEFLALVPLADCAIEDTWHVTGLAGTGSNDIHLKNVVVPEHRIVRVMELRGEETAGSAAHDCYLYRLPLHAVFSYNVVGGAIGIARGAVESVTEALKVRKAVTRAPLTKQQSAQLRIAEAGAEIDAAYALMDRNRDEINSDGKAGRMPDLSQRVRYRRDNAFAAQLCVRAVDRVFPLLGARGLGTGDEVQRAWHDVHAISHHIALTWDLQGPIHGAVALGEPCPDPRI